MVDATDLLFQGVAVVPRGLSWRDVMSEIDRKNNAAWFYI